MVTSSRHALVVAYLALILATSGTAYALTVNGGDVVNGSLTGRDIKSGSIPEGDLGFNAVALGDINASNFSSQTPRTISAGDGPTAIASVDTTVKNGFTAAFGTGTFSVTNTGQSPVRLEIRPYMDGKAHGEHFFSYVLAPGATELDTVSIFCNFVPGAHTVELRMEVVEGTGVTINQVEWSVWPIYGAN